MQSLNINLATRPFRNNTLLWAAYGLAFVLLIGFTYWNVSTFQTTNRSLGQLEDSVSTIDLRMKQLEQRSDKAEKAIDDFNLKVLRVQADKANDVISWRAFSWTRLFNVLEWVQPYDVRMTSVRPVFVTTERQRNVRGESAVPLGAVPVKVRGIAKDRDAFVEFQRELIIDTRFDKVEPLRRTVDSDTQEVLFELVFLYFPDGVEDRDPCQRDVPPVQKRGTPQEIYCTEGIGEPPEIIEATDSADEAEVEGDGQGESANEAAPEEADNSAKTDQAAASDDGEGNA